MQAGERTAQDAGGSPRSLHTSLWGEAEPLPPVPATKGHCSSWRAPRGCLCLSLGVLMTLCQLWPLLTPSPGPASPTLVRGSSSIPPKRGSGHCPVLPAPDLGTWYFSHCSPLTELWKSTRAAHASSPLCLGSHCPRRKDLPAPPTLHSPPATPRRFLGFKGGLWTSRTGTTYVLCGNPSQFFLMPQL